jgi:ArsR family transcriptional regulator, lead/cadmium/zinc/bismuth-responsive transcriptional repressor
MRKLSSPQHNPPTQHDLLSLKQLEESTRIFRVLSSPQRIRILDFLDRAGSPQRVTEIVAVCDGVQQAIVSQQLRILRDGGLVDTERDGNRIFYRIIRPEVRQYLKFLREGGFSKPGV